MTLVHYGKRRRGTASVTGKLLRVPENPYWGPTDDETIDESKGNTHQKPYWVQVKDEIKEN